MLLAQSENIQNKHYIEEDNLGDIKEEIGVKCEETGIGQIVLSKCLKATSIDSCLGKDLFENITDTNAVLPTKFSPNSHHMSELVMKDVMKGDRDSGESKKALQLYLDLWEAEQHERRLHNRRRKALQRAQETVHQRKVRREKDRFAKAALRAAETMEKKIKRRERDRIAKALSRTRETKEQREKRLEKNRIAMATLRAGQTDEEKLIRREKDRISKAKTRAVETEEQRRIRREKNRIAMAIKRASDKEVSGKGSPA